MSNIVHHWLAAEKDLRGNRHRQALAKLNRDLGKAHRLNRLYEWRSGRVHLPPAEHEYMLRHGALKQALLEHMPNACPPVTIYFLNENIIANLVQSIMPPKKV